MAPHIVVGVIVSCLAMRRMMTTGEEIISIPRAIPERIASSFGESGSTAAITITTEAIHEIRIVH